ncbi:Serine/threonine-protein phosphatase PP1-2 [Tritrichomonas foetus]|uniref:Serine/threonine-protein phosphatase n=1 Tax=Tritrichomonas foetus TaxID=1144522 RepID=A0A1J4KPL8_9EUKA|nr:Serine/threonine-protein phosphatase PP1-2 [Tritrichomonas foetus]|eukprot:OHT12848.1 Serine/threonine-protein phosphatase PP1-2 [Tritrichomonas foetus]
MATDPVGAVLSKFQPILNLSEENVDQIGISVPLPHFTESLMTELADLVLNVFKQKKTLVEIEAPIYIVGDIHGNIFDLMRILIYAKTPPASRLLFLGDYVDRGEYSIEVLAILFALQCAYPDHILLLRGNHEFAQVNQSYGFYEEVTAEFGRNNFWKHVNEVFQYMPLAAVVSKSVFCVHGGLSPTLTNPYIIEQIVRPIEDYDSADLIGDILWSDPANSDKEYVRSTRGSGVAFNSGAVMRFLRESKLSCVVRAHQCVPLGIMKFANGGLFTVFSSSNYEDNGTNRCGLLYVTKDKTTQVFSLPPLTIHRRKDVLFDHHAKKASKPTLTLNIKLAEILHSQKSSKSMTSRPIRNSAVMHVEKVNRSTSNLPPLK